ncbi:MAG: class I SAM-dependent methyltransferase, partial [Syntrophales bacterium LBB04]|nr:class I SAM-dependent methyltransferase [Syntrophales bacterium LBB04]
LQEQRDIEVLEVGCGIGTMVERMIDAGLLTRAFYTALDVQPDHITEARSRLCAYANKKGLETHDGTPGIISLRRAGQHIDVQFVGIDAFDFIASRGDRRAYDLLAAHAFLDLVDLESGLRRLVSAIRPGGLLYLTLNFDGATIFEPPVDPFLDAEIERLYHASMDDTQRGRSSTGRRILACLFELDVPILAAGSSDWVLYPGRQGFSPEESYFLRFIIETVGRALVGKCDLDGATLGGWLEKRHTMVENGQLIYIAHQLDVLGRIPL